MLPSQHPHLNEGFLTPSVCYPANNHTSTRDFLLHYYVTQPTTTPQRGILNSISMLPSQQLHLNEGFLTPLGCYPANIHTSTRDS
ncbi:hypothetical protein DPMN_175240 [Dreissena polymorpha]|uniref:Uncharacterized protein n=1 Tax=Dreissena polymorpha TaxID=45954 RepID=A0A9D4IHX3_DREPO|nr:hypothetical protein DPMN_175240 [Dreissena polymorpha]